jgi:outer membrane lipoprotein carrier protein
MTLVYCRNNNGVILSEGREAIESKDLLFPFTTVILSEAQPGSPATGLRRWGGKRSRRTCCSSNAVILLLIALVFAPGLLSAQQPTVHDLAQRVDQHYNQLHSLKAQFVENYEGMGRMRTESGTLLLLKPGRMRWDYTKPAGKLFLLDGKYAWFYSKGDPQVQRIGAKELDDLRSPLRFLLGHTKLEKEIDHLAVTPTANGSFTLAGVPHGQEKRVQRLALTVTSDGVITAMEIQETDGAETRFTFTDEQANAPISPATFRFTPPPGVPVVDTMPPV